MLMKWKENFSKLIIYQPYFYSAEMYALRQHFKKEIENLKIERAKGEELLKNQIQELTSENRQTFDNTSKEMAEKASTLINFYQSVTVSK